MEGGAPADVPERQSVACASLEAEGSRCRTRRVPASVDSCTPGRGGLLTTTDKFACPRCKSFKSTVVDSRPDTQGLAYLRWRHCTSCHQLFETSETVTGRIVPLHETPPAHAEGN